MVEERTCELSDANERLEREIAERKRTEEALRNSHLKLEALLNNLPVGVSVVDADRKILVVNFMLERILGIDRDGFSSRTYDKREYIRVDGTHFPVDEMPTTIAIREGREVRDAEIGVRKADGTVTWTNVNATPLPFDDWKAVVTTTDITERKRAAEALRESEERIRLAQHVARIGTFEWNIQTGVDT
jgi:PAS domain S-box-containing protein